MFRLKTIAPGEAREVALDLKQPTPVPGAEYFLTVSFELANDALGAAGPRRDLGSVQSSIRGCDRLRDAMSRACRDHAEPRYPVNSSRQRRVLDRHQTRTRVRSPRTTWAAVNC